MGKSSSSRKKLSKNTSQAHSRKRGRNESKRYKSSASHRRNDSISSDGDDYDSRSLASESSSSFEDDRRSRQSRVRKAVKSSKKRSRICSSSSESSREVPSVRRQARSKKKDAFEARKKSQKKKFRRNQRSSMSSDLCSCSDCQHESSSSDESEIERHRSNSKRNEKNKRKLGRMKSGSKRKRYKSRSYDSTCAASSGSTGYQDEENLTTENNSLRLRSVIIFPNENRDERQSDTIELNEEMLYDHNDHPCKSNDICDGGSKKGFPDPSSVKSEKKISMDDGKIEEIIISSSETFDVTGSRKDNEAYYHQSIQSSDRIGTSDAVKERNNEALNSVGNAGTDDLEFVLRQRALENLKKFRGGLNAKTPIDEKIQSASIPIPKAEICQTKSPEDQRAKVNAAMESVSVGSGNVVPMGTAHSTQNEEKSSHKFNAGNESACAKQDAACVTNHTIEEASGTASAVSNKPKVATPTRRKVSSNVNDLQTRVNVSGNPHHAKTVLQSAADKCAAETALAVETQSGKNNGDTSGMASGSASVLPSLPLEPVVANVSLNNLQEQTNGGSQLEQKTMSVMRGGEMVEVSYKVYIPKKAPALARRPLKR